ncbi:lycopene cyclase domain-containing protein [Myroides odoratus]|uniref:Lycopene cyclase domain-containing protein n=1 Tax=Myroides odoratus TaxID=256 RepID=A0A9Q6ZJH9_MYROD|nr:lycopene cyclase domain-containing protein [Myroides odoratus]EHQ44265.1 lycopene cyclase domain protein [Myroides odoratus DSM 2801]EKB03036.1 lycopene cyclase domain-containing protein [Myroides odoratus CIP 103059]QQU01544.1 lycopene cyclase domain-containing protein [Myroides odoratus]WQD56179.1 lycopene cyclase domain-containing protein [Myroides odoratus]STZ31605.1 lycopene cyclase domain [Myroides odoratus]
MISLTYSTILFLTVIICLVASFDSRIQFNKQFLHFFKASALVSVPFILWDIWFTHLGVWWFNTNYTIGVSIAGLPLEEMLFFIFIPFSCIFTYFVIDKYYQLDLLKSFNNLLVFTSIIILIVVGLLNFNKIYTITTCLVTVATLFYLHFIVKSQWISKASFVYTLLMLGFFPVNGVLTGTGLENPIVNYNPKDFLGIRMFTIPVEDMVYGYTQFLLIIYFFKYFQNKSN